MHASWPVQASRFRLRRLLCQQQEHPWQARPARQGPPAVRRAPPPAAQAAGADPAGLAGLFMAYAQQMQQAMQEQQQQQGAAAGAHVMLSGLSFHPPGAETPLLSDVNMTLPANQLGLIIGRSGSGKTTLLQLLAGLSEQSAGNVLIGRGPLAVDSDTGRPTIGGAQPLKIEQRMQQVGLVFQFPERHFLGEDLITEMTFTWPRDLQHWGERQALAARMQQVLHAVGLTDIPLNIPPTALSGGQQRRLALALQLARQPSLLLLDEPLAGLDWKARAEVVALLHRIKQQCTVLLVSHDLREIQPLVDCAWRMHTGGRLEPVAWPPSSLSELED